MSASDEEAFLKWLQKRVPAKAEAETPNMTSAALWWLAKLKSGNVLPGIGWPTMLPVDDLGSDYINAMKRDITRRGSVTAMGRFLKPIDAVGKKKSSVKTEVTIRAGEPGGESLKPGATITRTKRARHYDLFDLDTCRAGFERKYGKQEWDGDSPGNARTEDGD